MVGLIKQIAPILTNNPAFNLFIKLLEQTGGERTDLLRVVTYHRVDQPTARPWLDPGLISTSPEMFQAQMSFLASNYEVISALDAIQAFESDGQKVLPPRAVAITFDDAYCDFTEHAWPVLKQYRLPATLFVPTSFPDHPERLFWWDRIFNAIHTTKQGEMETSLGRLLISTSKQRKQAYKRLKGHIKTLPDKIAMAEVDQICDQLNVPPEKNCVLGWDSLRQLAREGVTLGAHTRTHPIMNTISFDEMREETIGSKQDLQREIQSVPQVFAYPSGIHNEEAVQAVEDAGFALAFTTERGINQVERANRLRLRRINVGMRTTMPMLRAQFLYGIFVSDRSTPSLKKV